VSESREFNEAHELDLIGERYKNVQERFPLTLKRLRQSVEFEQVWWECREVGLKDWHIFQSIANITVNYRIDYGRGFESVEDMQQAYMDKFLSVETESDIPVPISEYSVENMQFHLNIALASYLKQKGYVIKAQTPNFKRLRAFADSRYKYFQLDVEHESFFARPSRPNKPLEPTA